MPRAVTPAARGGTKFKRNETGNAEYFVQRKTKSQRTMENMAKRRKQRNCHKPNIKADILKQMENAVCKCHINMSMINQIAQHRLWFYTLPSITEERQFIKKEIGTYLRGRPVMVTKKKLLMLPAMNNTYCERCWRLIYGIARDRFRQLKNEVVRDNNHTALPRGYTRRAPITEKTIAWLSTFFEQVTFVLSEKT
jgi:hypothetical protein